MPNIDTLQRYFSCSDRLATLSSKSYSDLMGNIVTRREASSPDELTPYKIIQTSVGLSKLFSVGTRALLDVHTNETPSSNSSDLPLDNTIGQAICLRSLSDFQALKLSTICVSKGRPADKQSNDVMLAQLDKMNISFLMGALTMFSIATRVYSADLPLVANLKAVSDGMINYHTRREQAALLTQLKQRRRIYSHLRK